MVAVASETQSALNLIVKIVLNCRCRSQTYELWHNFEAVVLYITTLPAFWRRNMDI